MVIAITAFMSSFALGLRWEYHKKKLTIEILGRLVLHYELNDKGIACMEHTMSIRKRSRDVAREGIGCMTTVQDYKLALWLSNYTLHEAGKLNVNS